MARNILLKCPATGMHVQHWLADEPDATENSYRQIACPACTRMHFVNTQTGKLLGEKSTRAGAPGAVSVRAVGCNPALGTGRLVKEQR